MPPVPPAISRVAVLGAGQMGLGIALVSALHAKAAVRLYEPSESALRRGTSLRCSFGRKRQRRRRAAAMQRGGTGLPACAASCFALRLGPPTADRLLLLFHLYYRPGCVLLTLPPTVAALGEIDRLLGKDVSKGKLTEAAAREARARVVPLADLRDLKALEQEEAVELIMEVSLL
jgi:3-hydroxyacyl-CoA dehydrogenase